MIKFLILFSLFVFLQAETIKDEKAKLETKFKKENNKHSRSEKTYYIHDSNIDRKERIRYNRDRDSYNRYLDRKDRARYNRYRDRQDRARYNRDRDRQDRAKYNRLEIEDDVVIILNGENHPVPHRDKVIYNRFK